MKLIYSVFALLIVVLTAPHASAGPTIAADYTAGCSPLVVHFHHTDTCDHCTYTWNFGNSTPEAGGDTVSTTYIGVGSYTATVTLHNGASTTTSSVVITVYPAPTVAFSVDDTAVCPGEPVHFTSTSTSSIPGALVSTWNYGDGSGVDTGTTTTHAYTTPGYYNVTGIATSTQGCINTLTKAHYIHIYDPPVPDYLPVSGNACKPPASFSFANNSSGFPTLSYTWDFGDGVKTSSSDPTHIYTLSGVFPVKLVATDGHGCKDSLIRQGGIVVNDTKADFTYSTPCQNTLITFTNTSNPHTARIWNYGEGPVNDTAFNGSHTYANPGNYTVTLTVSNGTCMDVSTQVIHIIASPVADFTYSPVHGCPSLPTTFTAIGPPGSVVHWLFDSSYHTDGTSAVYATPGGIDEIDMQLTDPATQCSITIVKLDTVYNGSLSGLPEPGEGCAPLTVKFSTFAYTRMFDGEKHPYPYPIASYSWSFGAGLGTSTDSTPTYIYTDTGRYVPGVTATSIYGCILSLDKPIRIDVNNPHLATFTMSPLHACVRDSIYFIATPVDTAPRIERYEWDFGDATGDDTLGRHAHKFAGPGRYVVKMKTYYRGCRDSAYESADTIVIDSPKSVITGEYSCSVKTQVTFGDSSTGADSRVWLFGDGDTSTIKNPVHNYPSISGYQVKLATYNIQSGCRDTATTNVKLLDADPHIHASDTQICKNGTITFVSTIKGKVGGPYKWFVNDTLVPGVTDTFLTYTYPIAGHYPLMLIVIDEHTCPDTTVFIHKGLDSTKLITVAKPNPGFFILPVAGCAPLTVTLVDTTRDIPGATPVDFLWSFGDGATLDTNVRSFTHTYQNPGTYTVSDSVTDDIGCSDKLTKTSVINVYQSHAAFFTVNAHPCINVPITFTNTTIGVASSFWQFGDGDTSHTKSPTHAYRNPGTYDVILTTTDVHGCVASDTVRGYIVIEQPDASFFLTDSTAICSPFNVHFTNTSAGADTSKWSFGDGNTSVVTSPANLYTSPGLFSVRLIAINRYGCRDTAYSTVNIFGYSGAFSYTPDSGCNPVTVHFTSAFTNVSGITWDFADGITVEPTTFDTITHVYKVAGAFVPKLILSDNSGCQSTSIGLDTIKVEQLHAKFGTSPLVICAGTPFNLVDSSTYRWSAINSWTWVYTNDTNHFVSPLYTTSMAGTYPGFLKVSNSWGCSDTVTKNIIIYALPDVTAAHDTLICVGDSTTLTVTGASSYVWSPVATLTCTTCTSVQAYPAVNTTYLVTGKDANGCIDTSTVTISTFTPAVAGFFSMCENDTRMLSGFITGGTWSSSDTSVGKIGSSTGTVMGISAGTSVITYSLSNNCHATQVISVDPLPHAALITGDTAMCIQNKVVLTDSVAAGLWSLNNANATFVAGPGDSITITGITAGTDTVVYVITNACGSDTTQREIVIHPLPDISGTMYMCAGTMTTLNATIAGGKWQSIDPAMATVDTATGVVTGAAVGVGVNKDSARIVYTTALGCTDTTQVTVYAIPNPGTITGPDKMCKDAVFNVTDTTPGGRWHTNDTAIIALDTTQAIVQAKDLGTAVISYIVGPNEGGCMDTALYTVKIIDPGFIINNTLTDITCYQSHNGIIALSISNGIAPFTYAWSNGDSATTLTGLDTGVYAVKVFETTTQCTLLDTFHITQPDSLIVSMMALTKDICKTSTGSAKATLSGGTKPYTYQWSNNGMDTMITGVAAGSYTFSVTDTKGCMKSDTVRVEDTTCLGIIVHNGISANGDGINDTWIIEGLQYYPHNTAQVFDKWGDQVFEGTNYKNDWPGTGKGGTLLPDGTYYYLLKLNEPSKTGGEEVFTGALLIKR